MYDYCDKNSKCINSLGSFICSCKNGFYGNGTHCAEGSCPEELCPINEKCISPRSNQCDCQNGFERNESGVCLDIDECSFLGCDENADCINQPGSFSCTCRDGFYGSGQFCTRGQCNDGTCPSDQQCVSPRKIDCECRKGYLAVDSNNCINIDECQSVNDCHSHARCKDTIGSYECECKSDLQGDGKNCSCPIGYHLNEITILCDETNECDQENHCDENAVCYNTVGSYECECNKGLWGDGKTCYEGYILVLNAPWSAPWWVPK